MSPDEHLSRLREVKPGPLDWILWTDGSGHKDGLQVSFVWFRSTRFPVPFSTLSASTCGSVNRAELTALLDGLHAILEMERGNAGEKAGWTPPMPRHVMWVSDRQNLVLSVARDPETGQPVYKRDVDADLWARFEWYEKHFRVHPVHVARDTNAFQHKCDRACAATRKVLKRWVAHLRKHNLYS